MVFLLRAVEGGKCDNTHARARVRFLPDGTGRLYCGLIPMHRSVWWMNGNWEPVIHILYNFYCGNTVELGQSNYSFYIHM